ncbi:MAG TPA: hypothetical protein VFT74_20190 [Isosphaeraceae bacterium]|nr:hypothetical protein [Isosphaeraceae bacterium]
MSRNHGKILSWSRHLLIVFTITGLCVPALPTVSATPSDGHAPRVRTTQAFHRVRVLIHAVDRLAQHRAAAIRKVSAILLQAAQPARDAHPAGESSAEGSSSESPTPASTESEPGETPSEPEPVEPTESIPDSVLSLSRREKFHTADQILPFPPSAPRLIGPAVGLPRADIIGGAPSRALPIRLCRFTC